MPSKKIGGTVDDIRSGRAINVQVNREDIFQNLHTRLVAVFQSGEFILVVFVLVRIDLQMNLPKKIDKYSQTRPQTIHLPVKISPYPRHLSPSQAEGSESARSPPCRAPALESYSLSRCAGSPPQTASSELSDWTRSRCYSPRAKLETITTQPTPYLWLE